MSSRFTTLEGWTQGHEAAYVALIAYRDMARDEQVHDVPVRLQWNGKNGWRAYVGDPGYDTDHTGYWGSTYVDPAHSDAELLDAAYELVEECLDCKAVST